MSTGRRGFSAESYKSYRYSRNLNNFVATDDFIHYCSGPRLNTTTNSSTSSSISASKTTSHYIGISAGDRVAPRICNSAGSSLSGKSPKENRFAFKKQNLTPVVTATKDPQPPGSTQQPLRAPRLPPPPPPPLRTTTVFRMAPDPRGQEETGPVGSIIAGHRISLNVHYDNNNDAPDATTTSKLGGKVTPIEDKVVSTGALQRESSAPTPPSTTSTTEKGEKITHIDEVIMEGKVRAEVESEQESLQSSLTAPPSSTATHTHPEDEENHSQQEVRPITPETTSAHSAEAEMFKSHLKGHEFLNGPDQLIPTTQLKTWEPSGSVKIKMGEQGMSAYTPRSVPSLLRQAAEQYPDKNALAIKREGSWKMTTYQSYYQQVRTMAKAFIALGLERFHGVCILGFNSPEWFIADLAAIFAGGFAAGIYTTNSPEACEHCAVNCQAQIWVVEDQKQLDKVLKIRNRLPHLKHIIQYSGKPTVEGVLSWEAAMALGNQQSDKELEARLKRIAINQCCTLIYTSGTTGPPKGVMLSHDNITWVAHVTCVTVQHVPGNETVVSYLPLSHVAAQISDIFVPTYAGGTVYFAQPDALKGSLGQTLKEVRPTVFLGVPRVWEKIYEKMMEVGRKTTGVKKSIATWAKSVGLETNERRQRQNFNKPWGYNMANAIVFKKVKAVLGLDRCTLFLSGAAPIAPDVVRYFHSLDIPLTEIYGMSESTGPHTIGVERAFKAGSVGRTIAGCYTKLDNPDAEGSGEICMGGRHVSMGYLRMEEKTNDAIDDEGWLHSGDIGRLDKDGFLFITGRIKELIITAGGENIPPVLIEDILKSELPCISNAMLIGDKRKFLSILLTLKTNINADTGEPYESLTPACVEWCRSVGSSATSIADVLAGPDVNVMKAIQDGIDRANKLATSNAQKVQKWTILPKDFSIPGGEIGPTMKLKRPVVSQKYSETIERFYQ